MKGRVREVPRGAVEVIRASEASVASEASPWRAKRVTTYGDESYSIYVSTHVWSIFFFGFEVDNVLRLF